MSPTLHYLAKEAALRWRTRPSSPLARGVLTFTLAATAGGFLAGFAASADALRTQLARFGFDTLVVRSVGVDIAPAATDMRTTEHWAQPLAGAGTLAVLQQSPTLATTAWGQPVTVFVAPWPVLASLIPTTPAVPPAPAAVWLTRDWPAGRPATFQLVHGGSVSAISEPPDGPWHALLEGDALLVPPELAPPATSGAVDVVLFTPDDAATLPHWVRAIHTLFSADGRPSPAIQDPGPLRAALAALERSQQLWRSVVLGLLGLGVLLVFAAIGILEQREVRFSQALLRSLGIRRRLLWLASLGENFLLANAALAAALVAVHFGAGAMFAHLPSGGSAAAARLPLSAAVFLAAVVNAGVLASLAPLATALRQPIGRQLA
ncbi:MAG TPA: hypothetical protein VGD81_05760 [Opitutaceae bacterium]